MDLLTLLRSLGSVAVIILLVGLGVFVDRRRWFPGDGWKGLGNLVVNVAMPCSAFYSLTSGFTGADLASAGLSMAAYAATMAVLWLVSLALAAAARMPQGRRGVFAAMVAFSNTVFIGVPMTAMLFGEQAVKYAFMAFLPNTLVFWTIGAWGIRRDGEPGSRFFAKGWVLKLLTPALIATLLALALIGLDLKPPEIVMQATKTVGNMVSAAALIYCGILLSRMGFRNLKFEKSHAAMMALRFILAPALAWLALSLAGTGGTMLRVLIAQATMPVMSQIAIVASLYKADDQYAATGFMLSTVASAIFIPIVMILMEMFV